ncbi:MAG: type II toxin-antitoxin system HipA family toxin [Desulfovibrionaceae bacterium]
MRERLNVWFEDRLAGTITRQGKSRMAFAYAREWLQHPEHFPLSLGLPLREQPYGHDATHAFFANLLPEQRVRMQVERQLHVSAGNDYALLEAIGAECAGALAVLPEAEPSPGSEAQPDYYPLKRGELDQIIALLPRRPLLAGGDGLRLSLAGAQSKLSMVHAGEKFYLPLHGAPGTHILKPPVDDLPGLVENEAFCMNLAAALELDVPEVDITDSVPRAFLIKRYDRFVTEKGVTRLHQEDCCQALGVPPERKYENEGGPTLQDCFGLLDHAGRPDEEKRKLLRLVACNFLLGNADAHAKNYSLLYDNPPRPRLAPAYDIVCTGAYQGLGRKLAMKIGGQYDPDYLFPRHWERLAREAGLSESLVLDELRGMAAMLLETLRPARELFEERYGVATVLRRVEAFVRARCETTLKRLDAPVES